MNVKAMHNYCFRFACLKRTYRLSRAYMCDLNSVRLYIYYGRCRDTTLLVPACVIRLIEVSMGTWTEVGLNRT